MGDAGALVLGFVLAVMGIKLKFPHQHLAVSWMIPIIVLGLPIFDTSLVVFTRLREGRSPFKGGKDHTSHRLVALGMSQRAAVISLYAVCLLLGVAAIIVSQAPLETAQSIGALVAGAGVMAFIVLEVVQVRRSAVS
jgi:UDP-GlcNAc:undecaprenyl-phosphate GlcNAc-1-phosphate transferase